MKSTGHHQFVSAIGYALRTGPPSFDTMEVLESTSLAMGQVATNQQTSNEQVEVSASQMSFWYLRSGQFAYVFHGPL